MNETDPCRCTARVGEPTINQAPILPTGTYLLPLVLDTRRPLARTPVLSLSRESEAIGLCFFRISEEALSLYPF
jgi:hypothetical protein